LLHGYRLNRPMTYQFVRYETRGPVAIVTYDRQDRRNAWSAELYREAESAIERANADDAIGAIVLTHAGAIFCAGIDIKGAPEVDPETGRKLNIAQICMMQDKSWIHLVNRSKPIVAAVDGAAMGLGITQLLPVDIRIGGESSTWSFPFLTLGVMPELGCTALLPRLIGYGRALDIVLTSQKLTAQEAREIGLITRVVPDGTVLDEAVAVAGKLAAAPRLQVQLTRRMFRENAVEGDVNAYLQNETDAFIAMLRAAKAAGEKAELTSGS